MSILHVQNHHGNHSWKATLLLLQLEVEVKRLREMSKQGVSEQAHPDMTSLTIYFPRPKPILAAGTRPQERYQDPARSGGIHGPAFSSFAACLLVGDARINSRRTATRG